MTRSLPGTVDVEGREFIYVESLNAHDLACLADEMFSACATAPLPHSGGIIEGKAQIMLPDKTSFLAFSYKGDLQGWKTKVVSYCKANGRKWGFVRNGLFVTSAGKEVFLADCEVQFLS
jgi:hypothetical protein